MDRFDHHPFGRPRAAWIAAALAGTALLTWTSGRRAEKRHPPTGRFVDVDGQRLHYLEAGTGAPVVLLHGNGASAADFIGCGLFERLAARHRVIAFDRPGFGHSERPRRAGTWPAERQAALLAHALRRVGLADAVIVGHSLGTQVALALAFEPDAGVRGLVLVSGYYYPTLRLDVPLLATPRLPVIGDAMRYTVSAVLARALLPAMLRQMFHPRPVAPEFGAAVPASMIVRPWQLRAAAEESWLMRGNAKRLAPHYRALSLPVEIFAGTADRVVRQEDQSRKLHEELPHNTLHLLPGEGHMLHYAAPAAIARAVDRISAAEAPSGRPAQPDVRAVEPAVGKA
ncbi:alpha/beta fold hydrolase [Aromatoleum sp.]|uniref:alpha/beta fold hydrolase n=1 Tax=Aromatoleum sp. TaxID=2307007 RepID=UPI002FC7245E